MAWMPIFLQCYDEAIRSSAACQIHLQRRYMQLHAEHIIGRFCVAGISYKNADAATRGRFSIDSPTHQLLLEEARRQGIRSVFVVSTCNRTEIYGYAHHPIDLASLLCQFTKSSLSLFLQHAYLQQAHNALQHLFRVACGLDSQIVGDYEIQGQIKQAYTQSLQASMIGPIMDRTINFVFQASKKIRTTTALSSGTVSVSFAAIEWMQKNLDAQPKKTLLVGSGKFGRNVCKNIRHYLPQCELTVTNRTAANAEALATDLGVSSIPFGSLSEAVNEFDVILVCTNAMEPIIKAADFTHTKAINIIDLSVPANVEPAVGLLPGMVLVNVDEISAITENTIARRQNEIPKAEAIIADYEQQFFEWVQTHQHAPAIKLVKEKLRSLSAWQAQAPCEMADVLDEDSLAACPNHDQHIRKTVNALAVNLKTKKEKGCQFIEAYRNFLSSQPAQHKA